MSAAMWEKVERYCNDQIDTLHRQLEAAQPEATTWQLRGEIRALRRVLDLGKPPAILDPRTMIQPPDPSPFV